MTEFEYKVLSTIDKAAKELGYFELSMDDSSSPQTYVYKNFKKQFSLLFSKSNGNDIAVFSTLSDNNQYGYNLQIDTNFAYCGTSEKISHQIIEDVKSENGIPLNIIEKILNYMLY